MKNFVLFTFSFVCLSIASAQSLYMSAEHKQAYTSGTRMYDGTVSASYWQNSSSYDLDVVVDPINRLLTGSGEVVYQNNSPDTLQTLVLQAIQNFFKPQARRSFPYPDELQTDGLVIDNLTVAGRAIDLYDEDQFSTYRTYYEITLPEELLPGDRLQLSYTWHFTIPEQGDGRSGAIDSTSIFVAYWYPEIAVYNDLVGWDKTFHDGSAEYYHDFSDFKVTVEVPANFVVWASSPLLNPEEVLPKQQLDRLEKARNTAESVTIIGREEIASGLKMKGNRWRYEMQATPDFAFALSDHYIWEAASYEDETGSYLLNTAYHPRRRGFATVIKCQQDALLLFHNSFPLEPFPYKHFTIFNGLLGGGMEFPGMANDAAYSGIERSLRYGYEMNDYQANFGLTLHEMFHMYFPFMMGIDETRHGWMDESWAEFADHFSPEKRDRTADSPHLTRSYLSPPMVPTYTQPYNSGTNSYTIGAYSYYSLYHLLGEETFQQGLDAYMERWKGKHPTPYDYFFTFNDISGQDLTWFWQRWYFDFGYPELVNLGVENNTLTIQNEGGRPLAFELIYTYKDGSQDSEVVSPECWKNSEVFEKKIAPDLLSSIQLKTMFGSDALYSNNTWYAK